MSKQRNHGAGIGIVRIESQFRLEFSQRLVRLSSEQISTVQVVDVGRGWVGSDKGSKRRVRVGVIASHPEIGGFSGGANQFLCQLAGTSCGNSGRRRAARPMPVMKAGSLTPCLAIARNNGMA